MNDHRKSVRLLHYDYSQAGAYFITICVKDREPLFGSVSEDAVNLSQFGHVVEEEWNKTAVIRNNVEIDEYVVMPNHFHGIVVLKDFERSDSRKEHFGAPVAGSLSTIVRLFKQACTVHINKLRDTPHAPLWQRSYYEHIVRNDKDLQRVREYIVNNPLQWSIDEENPKNSRGIVGARRDVPL